MRDKQREKMPTDLVRSLQQSRQAKHVWKSLPAKMQGELLGSLERAKNPSLRQQRVKEVLKKSRSEFQKRAKAAGF